MLSNMTSGSRFCGFVASTYFRVRRLLKMRNVFRMCECGKGVRIIGLFILIAAFPIKVVIGEDGSHQLVVASGKESITIAKTGSLKYILGNMPGDNTCLKLTVLDGSATVGVAKVIVKGGMTDSVLDEWQVVWCSENSLCVVYRSVSGRMSLFNCVHLQPFRSESDIFDPIVKYGHEVRSVIEVGGPGSEFCRSNAECHIISLSDGSVNSRCTCVVGKSDKNYVESGFLLILPSAGYNGELYPFVRSFGPATAKFSEKPGIAGGK